MEENETNVSEKMIIGTNGTLPVHAQSQSHGLDPLE
jgi:hypothetical protein